MFVQSEINEKKNRVRDLIRRLDLAGILLRKQCNFAWLTGGGRNLVGIATEVGVASILITPEREYVLCNNIEAPRMADEEKVEAMGYEIRSYPWHDDREAALVAELAGNGPVGCDDQFGGLRNVGGEVARLRWSLTPPEITRYKELGVTAAEALEAAAKSIRPGDTENAIIGRLANNLWERGCDYITVFCAADDRIARFRHPIATDRRIEKRAMLCCNARKSGLIVSFTRFVQFGKVPAEIRRIYDANVYVDCVMMAPFGAGPSRRRRLQEGARGLCRVRLREGVRTPPPGRADRLCRPRLQGDLPDDGNRSGEPGICLEPVDYGFEKRGHHARDDGRAGDADPARYLPGPGTGSRRLPVRAAGHLRDVNEKQRQSI